jgi:ribosomal protein S18 acetylase RimI-like enzyme
MRPGRISDLEALVQLWREEVRAGTRDSVPPESDLRRLLAHFDWEARSRVIDRDSKGIAGAVLVSSRANFRGTIARIDPAAAGTNAEQAMHEIVRWGLQLSRAAGAAMVQVWVGPGHKQVLRRLGLEMARPWWRMDRSLRANLPPSTPVAGYRLQDGLTLPQGIWAEIHNRTFADHWSFTPRGEAELMTAKAPELCLMAVSADTGEPAALTLCQLESYTEDRRQQPVGMVSSVGTLPEHRRRGLATWMVAEGLQRLRAAGAREASLYVDGRSLTRAFDAYRKLGFALAFEAEVWEATFP